MTKPTSKNHLGYRPVTADELARAWALEQKRKAMRKQRNEQLINSARTPFVFAPRKMWTKP